MYTLFVIIHILVSLVLCVAVLLQQGKGGGLAGAFGGSGGAPQQLLGSRGMTTLLHKVTIWCGVGFMVTSLVLFMMSGQGARTSGSVLEDAQRSGEFGGATAPVEVPIEAPIETPPPATDDGGAADQNDDGGQ